MVILKGYILCVRPRLHPQCDFVLISRNGTQLIHVSHVFGRIVYLAIGKYINPTRLRQIIETESLTKLSESDQAIVTRDQKHTSRVAQVHYQKFKSQEVASQGQICVQKLGDKTSDSSSYLENVMPCVPFTSAKSRSKKIPFSKEEDKFLSTGIKKYGASKWTSILKDCHFTFHSSRKLCTLLLRSKNLKLI